MQDGLVDWLQYRGFYALLILALVGLGVLLGRAHRRRSDRRQGRDPKPGHRPGSQRGTRRRG